MITHRLDLTVDWGDCDPAGIVFYPRFFAYFDRATLSLFHSAGLSLEVMRERFGVLGVPLVDAQASFRYPCRPMDELVITSTIEEWRGKTFVVGHTIHNGETIAVTGREIRFWGAHHPEDAKRLRAVPIPPEVMERFEG